jgi:serine/threonine protein kinase
MYISGSSEQPPFKALKIIGKGGFCRVYEGTLEGHNKPVAIKAVRFLNIAY